MGESGYVVEVITVGPKGEMVWDCGRKFECQQDAQDYVDMSYHDGFFESARGDVTVNTRFVTGTRIVYT